MMKIDYEGNLLFQIQKIMGGLNIDSDFAKQVIADGGQIFVGLTSPKGVTIKLGINNKKFDEDDE